MNTQSNFPKIPFLLSIIFFFVFLLAFLFFYKAINNNDTESQIIEGEWKAEAIRRDELRELDQSIKTIEGERVQLETHFAKSSDIVPFLDTIEGLAPKVGAKAEVTSVNILGDHTGLMVGMKASGTFQALYKFITLLENSPYELEFVGMDIERQMNVGGTDGSSAWSVIFKIKLLSFVE